MFRKIVLLLAFSIYFFGNAQLSETSEISIITSGPGENLYEKFGHTSIRIKDSKLSIDDIYNYGVFDLDGNNFYLNFTKGFMKYKLARYPFYYSFKSAQQDGRWMKEQVLNLTQEEKNNFYTFLEKNALPKNASYFYDPFFNNCATKPRDIINTILQNKIIWDTTFTTDLSLRELMNNQMNQNTWGSFGINIALGSKLDKKASAKEHLYLPDYLFEALSIATIKRSSLKVNFVKETKHLLNYDEKQAKSDAISPFLVFSVFLIVVLWITFRDFKNKKRTKWLDFLLFFITGFIGCLILFLWFFTNHSTAPYNFNILWGFPINIIVAFYSLQAKHNRLIKKYALLILFLLLICIPIIWITKIQVFNFTIIPILILLTIRYFFLQKTLNS